MRDKILLVYPEMPPTFWSFRYALPFVKKKAAFPPIGLLTVAGLLGDEFEVSLVDMNVQPLAEAALAEADLVFVSAMIVQQQSFRQVIDRAHKWGRKVVAGGPYPTASYARIAGVDHFVLNEAEVTLPQFLNDYAAGQAKHLYQDATRPDLAQTPAPRFDLIDQKAYSNMALQYSRGCPFNCEFCDIIELFGRVPRTKSPAQFLGEMDRLYESGFRGALFIVDDNFIGNRRSVRQLLPHIIQWQQARRFPFTLFTEASVNLAGDEELMELMVKAGFNMVFLGLETPDDATLASVHKKQNVGATLPESVRRLQRRGLEVAGGFILGFDADPEDIFERQIRFIQNAAIPTAMVGLLTALPNTQLHRRLKAEGRLLAESDGNNMQEFRLNFRPRMDVEKLWAGYNRVLAEIYHPKQYFDRCLLYLRNLKPHQASVRAVRWTELRAFFLSLLVQTFSPYGWQYWKFLLRASLAKPLLLPETITLAVKGHHFFKMTRGVLAVDRFRRQLEQVSLALKDRAKGLSGPDWAAKAAEFRAYRERVAREVRREYRRLHRDFRGSVEEALAEFERLMQDLLARIATPTFQTQKS